MSSSRGRMAAEAYGLAFGHDLRHRPRRPPAPARPRGRAAGGHALRLPPPRRPPRRPLGRARGELASAAGRHPRATAAAIDTASLDDQDRITRAVIIAQIEYADDVQAAEALDYTVAAFPVTPSSILLSYLRMVVVTDAQQADAYLAAAVAGAALPRAGRAAPARGREAGLTPVAHLVQMAVDQIDRFLAAVAQSARRSQPPAGWAGADAWRDRTSPRCSSGTCVPAFGRIGRHSSPRPCPTAAAGRRVGLVHLPGRPGALPTPGARPHHDRPHARGPAPDRPRRRGAHPRGVPAARRGLFGLTDVRAIFARLQSDPALRWRTSQEILDAAEATVRRAEAVVGRLVRPPARGGLRARGDPGARGGGRRARVLHAARPRRVATGHVLHERQQADRADVLRPRVGRLPRGGARAITSRSRWRWRLPDLPMHPPPAAVHRLRRGLGPVLRAAGRRDGPVLLRAAAHGHAVGRRVARIPPRRRHGAARLRLDPSAGGRLHAREHAGGADRRRVGDRPLHRDAGPGAVVHDRAARDRAPARSGATRRSATPSTSRRSTTSSSARARCRCRCSATSSTPGSARGRPSRARRGAP